MSTRMHFSSNPELAGLVGFKYDEVTVYSRKWDFDSLISRGIVYSDRAIVAFPFVKFFNYEELFGDDSVLRTDLIKADFTLRDNYNNHAFEIDFSKPFYVTEKIDGCLGIAFFWNGEWFMKTAGSFDSFQARIGTKKLNSHDVSKLDKDYTYLFEIVDHEDQHPLTKYYTEDIYLIGKINKRNGIESKLDDLVETAKLLSFRMPEILNFKNLDEVYDYAKNMTTEHEGVVVTFSNGFKLKIKGKEFLKIQRIYHNLSKKSIFEAIKYTEKINIDQSITSEFTIDRSIIPEEFPKYREIAEDFIYELNILKKEIEMIAKSIADKKDHNNLSRRSVYDYVKTLFLMKSKFGFSYIGSDFIDVILNKVYQNTFYSEYFLKNIKRIWLEHDVLKEEK